MSGDQLVAIVWLSVVMGFCLLVIVALLVWDLADRHFLRSRKERE